MSEKLHIDLESKSRVNLLTDGGYNYASDLSTEILCMCYAFDEGEVKLWTPRLPFPVAVGHHIMEGGALYAHHAAFERLMFDYIITPDHGCPKIKLEQWHCTAFMARCSNMPAALANLARSLNQPEQKQHRGRELIKMLCITQADGEFYSTPDLLEEMYDYCKDDVEAERAACDRLRQPTDEEWMDYWVCERMNDRGILIDYELAAGCQSYAAEEEAELVAVVERVTKGEVTKAKGENLKKWIVERLDDEQKQITVMKRKGKDVYSLTKYIRGLLLDDEHLDPDVREVLQASDFAQRSSVSKFKTMQAVADPEDYRARGAFVANGASASGRYSSRQIQLHNFTRESMDAPAEVRLDIVENIEPDDIRDYYELPIMEVLSKMLRPALIPAEGKKFYVSDWSAIEGRVNPWLADSPLGELKLDLYRNNIDPYKVAAQAIYNVDYDDVGDESPERRVGKVSELACGFGGGAAAFLGMGRNYGVHMSREDADKIKDAWRLANPWAPQFWANCERAATLAVKQPGFRYDSGRLSYFSVPDVLCGGLTLFCELPCGRLLTYPDARIELKDTPWGEKRPALTAMRAAFTPKVGAKEWPRTSLWGGLLVENGTQGTAASLLRDKLRAADAIDLPVVMHIHDELIVESDDKNDGLILHELMNTPSVWAEGLPIKADVKVMDVFGK